MSTDGLPLAGTRTAEGHDGWSPELRAEFAVNAFEGQVGGRLLGETDRVRIWEIRLAPGERLPAHRHVLDYFWTAVTPGRSRRHTDDGTTREVTYTAGETRHFTFGPGDFPLHDLENTGDAPLVFVTVEFMRSANRPLRREP